MIGTTFFNKTSINTIFTSAGVFEVCYQRENENYEKLSHITVNVIDLPPPSPPSSPPQLPFPSPPSPPPFYLTENVIVKRYTNLTSSIPIRHFMNEDNTLITYYSESTSPSVLSGGDVNFLQDEKGWGTSDSQNFRTHEVPNTGTVSSGTFVPDTELSVTVEWNESTSISYVNIGTLYNRESYGEMGPNYWGNEDIGSGIRLVTCLLYTSPSPRDH